MKTLKAIILSTASIFILFANVANAEVDDDCLCIPNSNNEMGFSNFYNDAIDTCYVSEILNWETNGKTCDEIVFEHLPAYHSNTDSNYILTRESVFITFKENVFEREDLKLGDTVSISEISDEFMAIINSFEAFKSAVGEFKLIIEQFRPQDKELISLQIIMDKYVPYPYILIGLKGYLGTNISNIDTRPMTITTMSSVDSNVELNLSLFNNTLISNNGLIETVKVFDLYGRLITEYKSVNSNTLELMDLKGAYIIQVLTDKSTESIKYLSN